MKRLLPLLLLLTCTGCVDEVIRTIEIPAVTLRIRPTESLMAARGHTAEFIAQTLEEDKPLSGINVYYWGELFSDTTYLGVTGPDGELVIPIDIPVGTQLGNYEIRFKARAPNRGSSSTEIRTLQVVDTMPWSGISVDIVARGVRPDGSISAEPISPTQTMHSRQSTPLLPYLFFDNGSAAIPDRYARVGATGFTVQQLVNRSAQDVHYHVLDIIGQRARDFPMSTLTVTGTNSNSGVEKNNGALSLARAQSVRDYLVNTWGIAADRIITQGRNLPEIPTNPVTLAGMEENRRVEIASNDLRIIAPVKVETRESSSAGETVVRFETVVTPAGTPFMSWRITLDHNGTPVGQTLSGSGTPPAVQTMTIANASNLINQPLRYSLEAMQVSGRTFSDEGMTRIVPSSVERSNLERFAMIEFDFDRADINERARMMLELIAESISRDARVVRIDGFTDFTGSEDYNQSLSEARANSAVTSLHAMTNLPAATNVTGHGERDPKFDNSLPEGRQLNRRVEFTIEKSVQ